MDFHWAARNRFFLPARRIAAIVADAVRIGLDREAGGFKPLRGEIPHHDVAGPDAGLLQPLGYRVDQDGVCRDPLAARTVDLQPNDLAVPWQNALDRKSTRLNSSHLGISYAVFCLK